MAINTIIAGDALARGLRTEFINTWQQRYEGVRELLMGAMEFGLPSDKFEEIWGYYETAPYPKRRPWGEQVQSKPFRARNFTVENVSWDSHVEWTKEQRLFDQLKDLERAARRAGKNFGSLAERIFYQIIQATTDLDLLEIIPNAPDGTSLFNALDGDGVDRFGVSGGNIISAPAGVASSDAVRDDFYDGMERMFQFQDTEGQPALDTDMSREGFIITFNVTLWKVFAEAFTQTRVVEGSATPTNIILESGIPITLIPTQRITNNNWYMFGVGMDPKPVFQQIAMPLEEQIEVEENSDQARRTKVEGIFWEEIAGYGTNLPLGAMKIAA